MTISGEQDDVRVSTELIDQLNKLASRLTQMGEYEACDLIDTVVARVTAMPQRLSHELITSPPCEMSYVGYVRNQQASASGAPLPTNYACALPGGVEESRDQAMGEEK